MRESLVRGMVVEVLSMVLGDGWLADRALERTLRRERSLHSTERRAVAEAAYGILRRWRFLDAALEGAGVRLGALPTPTAHLLRYAAWLVVGEQESAAAAAGRAGPEVLPHAAALGKLAPRLDGLSPEARLGILRSVPDWLASLWIRELGAEEADRLCAALNERAPLTLRANTLKASRDQVRASLLQEKIECEPGRWSPWSLHLGTRTNVFGLKAFKAGLFEVQDEGSQLLAQAVGARPGERVIDFCAGAGGKSLALAAMMGNKGELVCCDVDEERLGELKKRARRAGVFCHRLLPVPESPAGDRALEKWRAKADRVLVDAPCSGIGALRRNPEARWRLTPETVATFPPRQKAILARAATLVRPGGRLVYATCALDRAENEEVLEAFLAAHPAFELAPLGLGDAVAPGPQLTLLPHRHGTDGFFVAALAAKK